jgi:hypothetical protein
MPTPSLPPQDTPAYPGEAPFARLQASMRARAYGAMRRRRGFRRGLQPPSLAPLDVALLPCRTADLKWRPALMH